MWLPSGFEGSSRIKIKIPTFPPSLAQNHDSRGPAHPLRGEAPPRQGGVSEKCSKQGAVTGPFQPRMPGAGADVCSLSDSFTSLPESKKSPLSTASSSLKAPPPAPPARRVSCSVLVGSADREVRPPRAVSKGGVQGVLKRVFLDRLALRCGV